MLKLIARLQLDAKTWQMARRLWVVLTAGVQLIAQVWHLPRKSVGGAYAGAC